MNTPEQDERLKVLDDLIPPDPVADREMRDAMLIAEKYARRRISMWRIGGAIFLAVEAGLVVACGYFLIT